ncbi:restriction endonuclease subunit S [Streptococcus suis]|uniref:restriction endonuclease subunit S n=1 Tax=Streptococcus suis TaxID=1307 RepID=UPI000400D1EE|nr:restriction endonuclease subunit S [Streptococcus suis]
MTKEKSTVPRLRFPGFTDAWKQRKLGEYFVERLECSAEGELLSVTISDGVRRFSELDRKDNSSEDKTKYKVLKQGDIVYNSMRMWQGASGYSIYDGIVSPAYTVLIPTYLSYALFFSYLFKRSSSLQIFQVNSQGLTSDTWNLKYKPFSNIVFPAPTLPEQEAIGSFFSDLDQLITLHQRKLDDVKELKKALLQKMFPKGNGNDFPELRFPEFTDAWKQRKLGEVADFSIKTNSLSRDKLSSYFYEVQNIHYGDILTKYDAILDVCNKELPSIIGSTISDFVDALLIEGDIVFADAAEDSTVGKAVEVRNFKGKNVVSGLHTIVARPKVSYAPYYLGYLINSTAYHNQILPLMQGTKVSSISKANLKSTTVVFPTLPEQEAIGSFFSDLDQLITLHQRQLDHLKLLKKALLQQMFI